MGPAATPARFEKGNTTAMAEFIYTMRKVRKAHGDKVILTTST